MNMKKCGGLCWGCELTVGRVGVVAVHKERRGGGVVRVDEVLPANSVVDAISESQAVGFATVFWHICNNKRQNQRVCTCSSTLLHEK